MRFPGLGALTALLSRLPFRQKFALVLLLVVISMSSLSAFLVVDRNRTVASLEQKTLGLAVWKPVIEVIKFQQRSRGQSNAWLSGDEAARAKMQAAMSEADSRLRSLEPLLVTLPGTAPALQRWRDSWAKVVQDSGSPSAGLTKAHTDAITLGLALLQSSAQLATLSLESQADAYLLQGALYEEIPATIELYGQFRALGTGINAAREVTPAQKDRLLVLESRINSQLQRLARHLDQLASASPVLQATVQDYKTRVEARREKIVSLIHAVQRGEFVEPQAFFADMTEAIDRAYSFSGETLFSRLSDNIAARRAQAERERWQTIGGVALLFVALLALFAAISRNVMQQVENVRRAAEALAHGDLTQAPESHGADELSEAVRSLASGINKLRDIFGDFARAISSIDQQSATLATASVQVARASEHQAETVAQLAATVEEMSAGVQHITEGTGHTANNARTTHELAGAGQEMSQQMVSGIGAIASHVEESAAIVQRLGEESAKISTIVGTIKEIADQTNLLALNAAIEAARAGESGRGFAVVADEVRKLAERTSGATIEISTNIGNIQTDISAAVTAMAQSVSNVQAGVSAAERTGSTITAIDGQASEVQRMVQDIELALQEQSIATQSVAHSIEELAQVSEENHSAADAVRDTTEQLRQQALQLEKRMRLFRV